jgi:hypothetical protein
MFVREIALVADATVVAPMQTAMSMIGEGLYAFSEIAELGTVTFDVDLPCDDTYYLWGRVWDADAGTGNNDPDSYYVSIDGGNDQTWFYGCQTEGEGDGWSWQIMKAGTLNANCNSAVDITASLPAGTVQVKLRNREVANFNDDSAHVARILVTNDANYVPSNME